VIHRDVKPSNVLIGDDGSAKLADLGIATAVDATSITTTNDIIGRSPYRPRAARERRGRPFGGRLLARRGRLRGNFGERAQRGQTPTEIVSLRRPATCAVWPAARRGRCSGGLAATRSAARAAPASWPTAFRSR
jgi:hypothetical protein